MSDKIRADINICSEIVCEHFSTIPKLKMYYCKGDGVSCCSTKCGLIQDTMLWSGCLIPENCPNKTFHVLEGRENDFCMECPEQGVCKRNGRK